MTPIRIAVCSGSWVVAANVISIAIADIGATRNTSLMSGSLPITSSRPMTKMSPPMTGIGMISAVEPAIKTSSASQMPAKMPAQRVCAPADVATPVRDSEPPAGRAPKKPPARLPTPWAVKSPDMLLRLPSGFGTAAEIPAACASATRATATPPTSKFGHHREVRNGQRWKRIRDRGDVADGLDIDVRDRDHRRDDDQGEQDRERLSAA